MNARFLRDEAARFRSMAADTDHEASRLRRLATADEYEARAVAAEGKPQPPPVEEIADEVTEPPKPKAIKLDAGTRLTLGSETVSSDARRPVGRPVGRPRLKLPNP
jgi:hypothetical protein